MKTIDKIHTSLVIIFLVVYFILCMNVQYKDPKQIIDPSKKLNDNQRKLLWITNSIGFILGIILSAYEVRYLSKNLRDKFIRFMILIICVVLILTTFYQSVYNDDPNTLNGRCANSILPLIFCLVIIGESSFNSLLVQYDVNKNDLDSITNSSDYEVLD
jgi:uncharacterized membrane protein YfcA